MNALEKVQEGHGEDYLEKIIQIPIQIPDVSKEKLREVLLKQMNVILAEYPDTDFSSDYWQKLFTACIDPFIKNIRGIYRLSNLVQFKLSAIPSEINFTDMVAISLLEISLPQIYEWVKKNKSILTGALDLNSIMGKKSQKECYEFYSDQIQSLLRAKDETSVNIVITFLAHLFPYFGQSIGKIYETYDLDPFRKNNQIAHPEKFDRYFDLNLDNIGLKKSEIRKAIYSLSCDDLSAYLLDCDNAGTSYELIEEIKSMIPEIPQHRVNVIIDALLNSGEVLRVIPNKRILSLPTSYYAVHTVIDLRIL